MMDDIRQWLEAGAEVHEGLRLLNIYAPNKFLMQLVSLRPERYRSLLVRNLSALLPAEEKAKTIPLASQFSFRKEWPFLQDADCPSELKVLAADKITAYHNYVTAHELLFECVTLDECYETAKKLIENYVENRKIISEFAYYKEHHTLLGKHPIFGELNRLAELRQLPLPELFRRRENLTKDIWRLRKQVTERLQPHLLPAREARLAARQQELNAIDKMLAGYGAIQHN